MPKRYFFKVYKDCVSLCSSIIRIKSFPSGWSGQKEDICPSIKKSIYNVQEGTVVRVDPGFVYPLKGRFFSEGNGKIFQFVKMTFM